MKKKRRETYTNTSSNNNNNKYSGRSLSYRNVCVLLWVYHRATSHSRHHCRLQKSSTHMKPRVLVSSVTCRFSNFFGLNWFWCYVAWLFVRKMSCYYLDFACILSRKSALPPHWWDDPTMARHLNAKTLVLYLTRIRDYNIYFFYLFFLFIFYFHFVAIVFALCFVLLIYFFGIIKTMMIIIGDGNKTIDVKWRQNLSPHWLNENTQEVDHNYIWKKKLKEIKHKQHNDFIIKPRSNKDIQRVCFYLA